MSEQPQTEAVFDPAEHTVDEVVAHVESLEGEERDAELARVAEAEKGGKGRSTLLAELEKLSQPEEEPPADDDDEPAPADDSTAQPEVKAAAQAVASDELDAPARTALRSEASAATLDPFHYGHLDPGATGKA